MRVGDAVRVDILVLTSTIDTLFPAAAYSADERIANHCV